MLTPSRDGDTVISLDLMKLGLQDLQCSLKIKHMARVPCLPGWDDAMHKDLLMSVDFLYCKVKNPYGLNTRHRTNRN